MEWCNHYSLPIRELKQQPVKIGEEVIVIVTDIHESGAGVGHTEDGFVIFVDGVLPDARSLVKITSLKSNHARAEEIERLPLIEAEPERPTIFLETVFIGFGLCDPSGVEAESTGTVISLTFIANGTRLAPMWDM